MRCGHRSFNTQEPFTVSDDAIAWLWHHPQGHPYFVTFLMRDAVLTIDQAPC